MDERGEGDGEGRTINVPIPSSVIMDDDSYMDILVPILAHAVDVGQPEAVMIVVGADAVDGDPLTGGIGITTRALCRAVNHILTTLNLPTVILGGGGYSPQTVARLAASVALTVHTGEVPDDDAEVPYNDVHLSSHRAHIRLHSERHSSRRVMTSANTFGPGKARRFVKEVIGRHSGRSK